MVSKDEAEEPIQRYTWFMVLTNKTNDFHPIQTGNKSTVSCHNTNLVAYTKKIKQF
jgi:hypothetical protein